MSELKLKLEELKVDEQFIETAKIEGEEEVQFFVWKRHAINEEIHITKSKGIVTKTLAITIFAKSGRYIPNADEITLIKEHFLKDKFCNIQLGNSITDKGEVVMPMVIYMLEVEIKEKRHILTRKQELIKSTLIN